MPKVLICASTAVHIKNFHLPYLKLFKELGYEVHVAIPQTERVPFADTMHKIPMAKSLVSLTNISGVAKLRRVVIDNNFDLVMTHTALAGIVGRVGALLAGKKKAKVIHTSHGYFFWKGCGIARKILYYTPERLLRGATDCVVTMNGEDYNAAQQFVKKGGLVVKVPGMGVDDTRFTAATFEEKKIAKMKLSIPDDAFVMVYTAEFSKRKNHMELIRAYAEVVKNVPEAVLLLCGSGRLQSKTEKFVNALNLQEKVRILGWCDRMEDIYSACDLAVSSSICEGLPFNIIEAQMCGLPVVASKIRGHTDLIEDGVTGLLYTPGNCNAMANAIIKVAQSSDQGKGLGNRARMSVGKYSLKKAFEDNSKIYMKI